MQSNPMYYLSVQQIFEKLGMQHHSQISRSVVWASFVLFLFSAQANSIVWKRTHTHSFISSYSLHQILLFDPETGPEKWTGTSKGRLSVGHFASLQFTQLAGNAHMCEAAAVIIVTPPPQKRGIIMCSKPTRWLKMGWIVAVRNKSRFLKETPRVENCGFSGVTKSDDGMSERDPNLHLRLRIALHDRITFVPLQNAVPNFWTLDSG